LLETALFLRKRGKERKRKGKREEWERGGGCVSLTEVIFRPAEHQMKTV
jgi:hypothetical protein